MKFIITEDTQGHYEYSVFNLIRRAISLLHNSTEKNDEGALCFYFDDVDGTCILRGCLAYVLGYKGWLNIVYLLQSLLLQQTEGKEASLTHVSMQYTFPYD